MYDICNTNKILLTFYFCALGSRNGYQRCKLGTTAVCTTMYTRLHNKLSLKRARARVSAYNAYAYRDLTSACVVVLNPGGILNPVVH